MEFEIEERLEGGFWDLERREKARTRQIDSRDMNRGAMEIPESDES
ncbi:MAG: hypothetical protein ACO1OX_08175 [Novosphingobium sp.]